MHSQVEVELFACGCALACLLHLELPLSARALISAAPTSLIHFLCLITLPVSTLVLLHSFSPSTHFSIILQDAMDGLIMLLKWLICVVWNKKNKKINCNKGEEVLRPSFADPQSIISDNIRQQPPFVLFFQMNQDWYIILARPFILFTSISSSNSNVSDFSGEDYSGQLRCSSGFMCVCVCAC